MADSEMTVPETSDTPETTEKEYCNATKTAPGETLVENVAWVNEFKKVNLTPTSGYAQHVNVLGVTTFACVNRLSNDGLERVILAAQEVLAQRAFLKGKENNLPEDKSPEDAAKRLSATAEFAKKRTSTINEELMNDVYDRVRSSAKRSGIILNIPGFETADVA